MGDGMEGKKKELRKVRKEKQGRGKLYVGVKRGERMERESYNHEGKQRGREKGMQKCGDDKTLI